MLIKMKSILYIIFILYTCLVNGLRTYNKSEMLKLREEVKEMFQHAYDSYLKYAYPYDELRPLSCDGIDTWGSYSLTLIDALDTLAIMGNYTEFQRVVNILTTKENFDANINVSVFETNIRIIGGLLSAHLMSHRAGVSLEPGWPCNGPLLRLAEDVARRLIAAFDTESGMPYGTVNLRYGVPAGETTVTCTAGIGTFILEFGTLTRLTGDPLYEEVALNALYAVYEHRSAIGLVGNHIDIATGRWTAQDAGIGGGVDSYYEYLVKGAMLLQRPELMHMFGQAHQAIRTHLARDHWHLWVSMTKGHLTLPVFQSLQAYWPGLLSLIGDTSEAMKSLHNYHQVWKQYGFTPELYNIPQSEAGAGRESYPLRPELIESVMHLYRATYDPYLLQVGEDILRTIQHSAYTPCGYATIKDVRDHRKEDRMESFFLAETTKYLYLLFDTDNFIHNQGQHGTVIKTAHGHCVIDAGGYIFNTEAHPIDPAALHCCSQAPNMNLFDLGKLNSNKNLFRGDSIETRRHWMHEKQKQKLKEEVTITQNPPTETVSEKSTPGEVVEVVKFATQNNIQGESELPNYYKPEDTDTDDGSIPDKIQTISNVVTETSENESQKELFREDVEKTYKILPEFVNQFMSQTQNIRPKFDPQRMLERLRSDTRYPRNSTWENSFHLLSCEAQPFLQKISIVGEFFST